MQDGLHAALGATFLALMAVGIWKVLNTDNPKFLSNEQPILKQNSSGALTTTLFAVQNERIENAVMRIDCILNEGRQKDEACNRDGM